MGKMWDAQQNRFDDAAKVLTKNGIEPISLGAKEGKSTRIIIIDFLSELIYRELMDGTVFFIVRSCNDQWYSIYGFFGY
jgi:hypothetical protein